ncbi:T cell receptor beta chain MC.7.G5-like [Phyllopteryx taeniolatus]|uniref:T cell receptor beta chain MC.7.G5-like n=1 Tax=Phyllopteryx taeniolatus TaxID=161469 RepID=UPI002AD561AF|nr:T cell receptor beta chain MC.7.G5-like [Phyllopteryx taeniolatus]
MFLLLLSIAASVTLLSGLIVTQTPADIIAAVGQSATLECSHQKTSYNQLLWYRQRGVGMQLIGYMYYENPTMEPDQDVKLEGSAKPGEKCKMTFPELRPNSSAVYYCVASDHGAVSNRTSEMVIGSLRVPTQSKFEASAKGGSDSRFQASVQSKLVAARIPAGRARGFCGSSAPLCSYDEAFFGAGTKLTVLDPNVKITPPTVKLLPPSDGECTNQKDKEAKKKTLVCAATDFYPDHVGVAWMVDSQKRDKGVATDSEALRRGLGYSITSRLRVPASEWLHGSTNFTCVLTFFDGTTYSDYAESISGKDDSAGGGFTRESFLRLTQSAKLSYAVLIAKSCVYAAFVAFLLWRFRVGCALEKKIKNEKCIKLCLVSGLKTCTGSLKI